MADWDKRFMDLAKLVATWSKDRSTKLGAIVVDTENTILSVGYNGFPRGANDDVEERHGRPAKYAWTEHAERNAIYNAVRHGVKLSGSRIYVPWFPCTDCARAIINSGISCVIAIEPDWNDARWGESFKISKEMFEECNVNVIWYKEC